MNSPITQGSIPYSILNYGYGHSKYEQVDASIGDMIAMMDRLVREHSVFKVEYYKGNIVIDVWRNE